MKKMERNGGLAALKSVLVHKQIMGQALFNLWFQTTGQLGYVFYWQMRFHVYEYFYPKHGSLLGSGTEACCVTNI